MKKQNKPSYQHCDLQFILKLKGDQNIHHLLNQWDEIGDAWCGCDFVTLWC